MNRVDSQKTKNDEAWGSIFAENTAIEKAIDSHGYYDIESSYLKEFREPRLLCKIDFKEHIPQPLLDRALSVIAIRNGVYRLARTEPFINIPDVMYESGSPIKRFEIPRYIEALSPSGISSSESKALDAALVSGMLDYVFNDNVSLVLRGREFCQGFNFQLNDSKMKKAIRYDVEGVQLEIDGGYEGPRGIYLVEAKMKPKTGDNMNIRQLLYPQLHYDQRFGSAKPVRTYYMLYDDSNKTYFFAPIQTYVGHNQNSSSPVSISHFIACKLEIHNETHRDYWKELQSVKIDDSRVDHSVPFPQANDFDKVFSIYQQLIYQNPIAKEELFNEYPMTSRQFDYYGNVLRWLRIASYDRHSQQYYLTSIGQNIASLESSKAMRFEMASIALANSVFNNVLHGSESRISQDIRQSNRLIADDTFFRRLGTVRSWLNYFESIFTVSPG